MTATMTHTSPQETKRDRGDSCQCGVLKTRPSRTERRTSRDRSGLVRASAQIAILLLIGRKAALASRGTTAAFAAPAPSFVPAAVRRTEPALGGGASSVRFRRRRLADGSYAGRTALYRQIRESGSSGLYGRKKSRVPKWVRRVVTLRPWPSRRADDEGGGGPAPEHKVVWTGPISAQETEGADRQSLESPLTKAASPGFKLPGARWIDKLLSFPAFELKLGLLAVLSSLIVAVGTLNSLPRSVVRPLDFAEDGIAGVFLVEYVLRWYCKGFSPRHALRPFAIIDFLSFLPLTLKVFPDFARLLPGLSYDVLSDNLLVNLRLLRLLRLQRFLTDYETFERFQLSWGFKRVEIRQYQLQLARVLLSSFTLLSVSTGLIYTAEHAVNPTIPDYFTALYFGLTTLTTVGFGDITPITPNGRFVVCMTIIAGAVIIPAQISAFVEALVTFKRESDAEKAATSWRKSREATSSMQGFYEKYRRGGCPDTGVLVCPHCSSKPHRTDAVFCWGCGSALPVAD